MRWETDPAALGRDHKRCCVGRKQHVNGPPSDGRSPAPRRTDGGAPLH
jgi:hypothetical protein